jgi:hypothetical protein
MLAVALALSAAVVTQATPALAATAPQVTIACAATNECSATGTGFTPSGTVQVQALAGSTSFATSTIVASATTEVCVQGLKPHCVDVPRVDQIQASYSGSLVPYYAPSSASEAVTVWPFA